MASGAASRYHEDLLLLGYEAQHLNPGPVHFSHKTHHASVSVRDRFDLLTRAPANRQTRDASDAVESQGARAQDLHRILQLGQRRH